MRPYSRISLLITAALIALGASRDMKTKYHPGHYVAIQASENVQDIRHLDEKALRGVIKRYTWKRLEPERDRYNFSSIERDLDFLAGHNKQLIAFIIDKSFGPYPVLPAYLANYKLQSEGGGICAMRWDPFVIDRMIALGHALGEAFDVHPNFEGVAIQESSLGIPIDVCIKNGYTSEKYKTALLDILIGLKGNMKRSQVFWYMNFLPQNQGDLREIAQAIVPYQIAMGGPDILPHRKYMARVSYPLYKAFKDKIPLFCSAQNDSYKHHKNDTNNQTKNRVQVHAEGYLSMEKIFTFARDDLHVDYVFWQHKYEKTNPAERDFDDAIEVIRKYPTFNATTKK